jgi:hypothetical protein
MAVVISLKSGANITVSVSLNELTKICMESAVHYVLDVTRIIKIAVCIV